jgi:hypothetical protein
MFGSPLVRDELHAARQQVLSLLDRPFGDLLSSVNGAIYSIDRQGNPRITILADKPEAARSADLLNALCQDTGNPLFAAASGFTRVVRNSGLVPLVGQHCNRRRPPGPGMAVSAMRKGFYGTIGMQLRHLATGNKVFITAAHVLGHHGTLSPGLPVMQPTGSNRRERIGTLLDFTRLKDGQPNQADVAVVKLRSPLRNKLYRICNAERGTYSYFKIKSLLDSNPPQLGDRVISSGAERGFFRGYYDGSADVRIDYENLSDGTITRAIFTGQHVIQSREEPVDLQTGVPNHSLAGGNSGAIVLNEKSRAPLGMIFAGPREAHGTYFVTPIETILHVMGLALP